jgi:hypothetical protein
VRFLKRQPEPPRRPDHVTYKFSPRYLEVTFDDPLPSYQPQAGDALEVWGLAFRIAWVRGRVVGLEGFCES